MKYKTSAVLVILSILGTWSIVSNSKDSVSAPLAPAAPSVFPANDPNIFVNLSKKTVPSVVNISTLAKGRAVRESGGGGSQEELFRRFFEDFFQGPGGGGRGNPFGGQGPRNEEGPRTGPARPLALGTGFIVDAEGLILTNNHVVAGADEIKIYFTEDSDEKPTDGEVVGRDPELDLALIRVKTKRALVPMALGDSDALQIGEYVMAVGNPFGQGHSVTHGIISAKGRKSPDFALANYIQTDTPINPGNSGGPLVNLKGEVIGINNAIDARAQGIGFAIPINLVKAVLPQLRTKGSVSRGYIGVQIGDLSPEIASQLGLKADVKGVFVAHVQPGGAADRAGVKPYDIITEFNSKAVSDGSDLIQQVSSVPVNDHVSLKVLRKGKPVELKIKVSQRPTEVADAGVQKTDPKAKNSKGEEKTGLFLADLTPKIARELGLPPQQRGALVEDFGPDSPADAAGFEKDDIIIEVDQKKIDSAQMFWGAVNDVKSYLVRVRRKTEEGDTYAVLILDLRKGK